ncbi:methylated-DNA--[protein]-cysteine S-methyltransferase [Herpetosiphon giganteus]|uniref:methylated-DNA--[protein]-cysteine S-methyltransferase n=1 Tax=Herpetosiphon giganteus TaxID=2029754 RepID=UPI0019576D9B|nr:methylated-DNA--[protein]-cysteine S-methyltransferase [Herpetosiphon giganteus]MBM7844061.1 O-6-methylguanine DNA methyltransferase [Herpetosiphon giganteus]
MQQLMLEQVATPIGDVVIISSPQGVVYLDFGDNQARCQRLLSQRYGSFELMPTSQSDLSAAVARYFAGDLAALDLIKVDLAGSEFQRKVWLTLREIGVGQTMSYGQLAAKVGTPSAARAIGMTNGLNPISLVLPCHRVIGANKSLTGYAGGLERKRWLLRHEGAQFKDLPKQTSFELV